jgi:hypothetical protein
MVDLDGDGLQEVVLLERAVVFAFHLDGQAKWQQIGTWVLPEGCQSILAEMRAGRFGAARPQPGPWPDLEISGQKFRLRERAATPACPN